MKNIILATLLLFLPLKLSSQTWDLIDKSMAAWNLSEGLPTNKGWKTSQNGGGISITQQSGYVNITKTAAAYSNNYAFIIPEPIPVAPNQSYSISIKMRLNPINKNTYPDSKEYFESNQISARINNRNMAVHIKYGDHISGYLSTLPTSIHSDANKYKINTSEWHVYRFVFHNSFFDVFVDDIAEPIFENVPTTPMTGTNILRLGAESQHRCNMDIQYAKVGTGSFYSKPKIVSISLSTDRQPFDQPQQVTATIHTAAINDDQQVLISLIDSDDNTVVSETPSTIKANTAKVNISIPAGLPIGKYRIRASLLNQADILPQVAPYRVSTSAYTSHNLATFGNSITSAQNSWAYQTAAKLGFHHHYNGAISAAIWYKRQRTVAGQTIHTQNFDDPNFAGISSVAPSGNDILQHQRRINNCAIVHIQKYLLQINRKQLPAPDVIIFSYGTNDELDPQKLGSATDALKESDLNKVNIFTMAGATRWSIDTLQRKFPDAKIYLALPLQSAREGKNEDNLIKMKILKEICDARGITYFDCFNESGITLNNEATYLYDRLHPNAAGQELHAEYIISCLEREAHPSPSHTAMLPANDSFLLTPTLLRPGQQITIKCTDPLISLRKVGVFNLAGSLISQNYTAGSECSLPLPNAAGIYFMQIVAHNNTSKTVKIILK